VNRISAGTSQSTAEKRTTPAISGPVSIVRVEEGQSSEEPSGPTTWSSLVDPELLKNISPQERKHQEVCFLITSIPEVSADRNGALRPYSNSSLPREPVSCRSGGFRSTADRDGLPSRFARSATHRQRRLRSDIRYVQD
jgi:hypothetical protein